jgi:hypothetical protein
MLDRFLTDVVAFDGVWFATAREVAERVRAAQSPRAAD